MMIIRKQLLSSLNGSTFKMSKLTSWLQENRINPNADFLRVLEDLGATEVSDLLDLEKEDILTFQPPVLKKLEFVRFQRGIDALHRNVDLNININIHGGIGMDNHSSITESEDVDVAFYHRSTRIDTDTGGDMNTNVEPSPSTVISTAAKSTVATTSSSIKSYEHSKNQYGYQYPPLPPQCPEKDCNGTLACSLGKRRNKNLIKIPNTPDFRWMVSCNKCSVKWHACHFLCGHMARISTIGGSSDIIRHEMGRFNRWQKKIKPPCANNPMNRVLKAEYDRERTMYVHREDEERKRTVNADGHAHSHLHSQTVGQVPVQVSHQHKQNPGDNVVEQIVDCNKATGSSDDLWFSGETGEGALAGASARIGNDELNADDLIFNPNDAFFTPGEELKICPIAKAAASQNNNENPKRVKLNNGGAAAHTASVPVECDPSSSKDMDHVCCEMEKLILAAFDDENREDDAIHCENK